MVQNVISASFWRFFFKHWQNRQNTCYGRRWPIVGKLIRKCKNGPLCDPKLFADGAKMTKKKKMTSRRKMTSRCQNITKMETRNPFPGTLTSVQISTHLDDSCVNYDKNRFLRISTEFPGIFIPMSNKISITFFLRMVLIWNFHRIRKIYKN